MAAAAFLTGVDLEGRLAAEEAEEALFALPAPPPRRERPAPRVRAALEPPPAWAALPDEEQPKLDYASLLREVSSVNDEDPLEELRRLIRRTRQKMDDQTKVLNGFISDVQQIRGLDQSFSSTDLAPYSSFGGALAGPPSQKALRNGPAGGRLMGLGDRAPSGPLALGAPPATRRPTSASNPDSRVMPMRSQALSTSRSQPALVSSASAPTLAAAAGGGPANPLPLALRHGFEPLTLPARRPPPGAPGSQRLQASAAARAAAAAAAAATAVGGLQGKGQGQGLGFGLSRASLGASVVAPPPGSAIGAMR